MAITILTAAALIALSAYLFWLVAFKSSRHFAGAILAYHHVESKRGFPATHVSRTQFEQQMATLAEKGYRFVTPEEMRSPAQAADAKRVCLTFDDSYESIFQNALPFLRSLSAPAMLFVISDYIGQENKWDVNLCRSTRHMSEEQLRRTLDSGFRIGSHTRTHPDLTALSPGRLKEELTGSKKALEDRFSMKIRHLAYPFGRHNKRVREAVAEAGYQTAFSISRPLFQRQFDPLAIAVSGVYSIDSPTSFLIKVEGRHLAFVQDLKDKIINRFADGTALVKGARLS